MIILAGNGFRVLLLGGQRVVIIQDLVCYFLRELIFFFGFFLFIYLIVPNYMFLKKITRDYIAGLLCLLRVPLLYTFP